MVAAVAGPVSFQHGLDMKLAACRSGNTQLLTFRSSVPGKGLDPAPEAGQY
eukprot:gene13754-14105_t